jgi:hypothetical protein
MEFYGYVDGLWEIGSYITVTIDTSHFDISTAVHELGHSVSYYFVDELFYEWLKIAKDKSEAPPTDYAKTEISEDAAESFSCYFGASQRHELLKINCPKRYAFMEHVRELGSSAVIKDLNPTSNLSRRFSAYDEVIWQ